MSLYIFLLQVANFTVCIFSTESCKNAFTPHPITGRTWDLVFNCAAETRPNQTEAVYKEGILKLSMNCANEAANIKVKRFIELSSGCVNSSEKVPQKEDCKHEPWTSLAKQKLKVERELETLTNVLDYTVVRLPIVYGLGDKRYLCEYSYKIFDNSFRHIHPYSSNKFFIIRCCF